MSIEIVQKEMVTHTCETGRAVGSVFDPSVTDAGVVQWRTVMIPFSGGCVLCGERLPATVDEAREMTAGGDDVKLDTKAMLLDDESLKALLDAAPDMDTLSIMRIVARGQHKKTLDAVEAWLPGHTFTYGRDLYDALRQARREAAGR